MNLAKNIKGNKKDFCKYLNDKRKIRENVVPLLKETGNLDTQDNEGQGTECLLCRSLHQQD